MTAAGAPAAETTRLVVGQRPEGFDEDTALAGELPGETRGSAAPPSLSGQFDILFRLRDLRKDMLLVDPAWYGNHRYVTADKFEQVNAEECAAA